MTQFLPPNLLALFAPRDPVPFVPPPDKPTHEKKRNTYTGVATFLTEFEDPKDTPPPTRSETKDERQERKRKEKLEQAAYKLEQDLALWAPGTDGKVDGDPYRTLFVSRVNYDTSESKLRREFEVYGPIKKTTMIHNILNGKPRGYAFVEYEHERDMHSAYKRGDGKKIDGRRVLLDVERGRTIKGWRPRRLGGGLGSTRKGGPEENSRYSGRDDNAGRMDNRSRSRSRERPERFERRRKSRSRSRDRSERKRRRSRSRERRRRSRSKDKKDDKDRKGEDRERRRRRSRSKDRKRSRSPRDRKRRRSRSRDRKAERGAPGGEEGPEMGQGEYPPAESIVKQEPINEAYEKYKIQAPPPPMDDDGYANGNGAGEYGNEDN